MGRPLVGVSFSGSIETGIGAVVSAGFDDLLLVNYKLSDASPLWFKSIGGVGEERFHSLKTEQWGLLFYILKLRKDFYGWI